jgi:hypothetical protein
MDTVGEIYAPKFVMCSLSPYPSYMPSLLLSSTFDLYFISLHIVEPPLLGRVCLHVIN